MNVMSLVPNGQLRLATVGLPTAPPTARARAHAELLRESLGEGAWGYSTGLEYAQERARPRKKSPRSARAPTDGSSRRIRATATRAARGRRGGYPHRRARRECGCRSAT